MTEIALQVSETLLERVRALAGGSEHLHEFLIQAIEREVERQQQLGDRQTFWDTLHQLRAELEAEGIELDPEQLWGDVRDRSTGREIHL
ncbi:MAG: hypothetical protein AAFX40_00550 [Cyanobacteria bacterium J06639_1]